MRKPDEVMRSVESPVLPKDAERWYLTTLNRGSRESAPLTASFDRSLKTAQDFANEQKQKRICT